MSDSDMIIILITFSVHLFSLLSLWFLLKIGKPSFLVSSSDSTAMILIPLMNTLVLVYAVGLLFVQHFGDKLNHKRKIRQKQKNGFFRFQFDGETYKISEKDF